MSNNKTATGVGFTSGPFVVWFRVHFLNFSLYIRFFPRLKTPIIGSRLKFIKDKEREAKKLKWKIASKLPAWNLNVLASKSKIFDFKNRDQIFNFQEILLLLLEGIRRVFFEKFSMKSLKQITHRIWSSFKLNYAKLFAIKRRNAETLVRKNEKKKNPEIEKQIKGVNKVGFTVPGRGNDRLLGLRRTPRARLWA